jgi:hypothetical protein
MPSAELYALNIMRDKRAGNTQILAFAQKIFESFKSMGIEGFSKAEPKPIAVFYQEEEAYTWKEDNKLGFLFESKVYNCYSLRNSAHNGGQEKGRFPFEDWKILMEKLLKQPKS